MKRTLLSLAVAASLGVASASAFAAFEDFVVDTTPFSSSPKTFVADKITGNYSEVITFTGVNTFAVSILWNAGQFVKNDGNNPVLTSTSQLNTQYGLYATFQGTGTVVLGPTTLFTLTPGSGSYSLYADNNLDTDFDDTVGAVNSPANGLLPWIADVGTNLDDVLLATGDTVSGSGLLDTTCSGGINCGSFGQNNTFALTAAGKTFLSLLIRFTVWHSSLGN